MRRAHAPEKTSGLKVAVRRQRVQVRVPVLRLGPEIAEELPGGDQETDAARRPPPRGRLFQEHLLTQPFWMVVACCLVNRTTWEVARLAHSRLKLRYGGPEGLSAADPEDLQPVIKRLGLWRQRSRSLVNLARTWVDKPPLTSDDVAALPGCGRYAADSWAIFIEDRLDVEPDDGKLNWYLRDIQQRS